MSSTPSFIENFKFEISHENLRRLNEAIERLFEKWSPYGFNNLTDIGFGISQLNYQLNVKENLSVDMLHENLCKFSNDWTQKAAEAFETNQFEADAENKTADIPDSPKEIETKNPPVNVFVNPTFVFGESSYRCNVNVYQQVTTITLPDKSQITINCQCRWQPAADLPAAPAGESTASADTPKKEVKKRGRPRKDNTKNISEKPPIFNPNHYFYNLSCHPKLAETILTILFRNLYSKGFLFQSMTSFEDFRTLFFEKTDCKYPIIYWHGFQQDLAFFIHYLVEYQIISGCSHWLITSNRFDVKGRQIKNKEKWAETLRKCVNRITMPKGEKIHKLFEPVKLMLNEKNDRTWEDSDSDDEKTFDRRVALQDGLRIK